MKNQSPIMQPIQHFSIDIKFKNQLNRSANLLFNCHICEPTSTATLNQWIEEIVERQSQCVPARTIAETHVQELDDDVTISISLADRLIETVCTDIDNILNELMLELQTKTYEIDVAKKHYTILSNVENIVADLKIKQFDFDELHDIFDAHITNQFNILPSFVDVRPINEHEFAYQTLRSHTHIKHTWHTLTEYFKLLINCINDTLSKKEIHTQLNNLFHHMLYQSNNSLSVDESIIQLSYIHARNAWSTFAQLDMSSAENIRNSYKNIGRQKKIKHTKHAQRAIINNINQNEFNKIAQGTPNPFIQKELPSNVHERAHEYAELIYLFIKTMHKTLKNVNQKHFAYDIARLKQIIQNIQTGYLNGVRSLINTQMYHTKRTVDRQSTPNKI